MLKNCLAEQLYILLFARQSKSPIANNIYMYIYITTEKTETTMLYDNIIYSDYRSKFEW